MSCSCNSYNWDIGKVPEKILAVPDFLKPMVCETKQEVGISIDFCSIVYFN